MRENVERCAFAQKKACVFAGCGCDDVSQKSCYEADRIALAYYSECPAAKGEKCDIPRYRALLPSGRKCGDENGCNVPRKHIPIQEFEFPSIFHRKDEEHPSAQEVKLFLRKF